MNLKLERPICFFDLETTGLDKKECAIIEIAIVKLYPAGITDKFWTRVNPEMDIPEESTEIHGITNEMVKGCPTFLEISETILSYLDGSDIGGYNSNNFDLPVLNNHFLRAGISWDYNNHRKIDVGVIFKRKEERTLSAAMKFYCDKTLEDAHSALADTEATLDVFMAQLERYPDLPNQIQELELYTNYDKQFADLSGNFAYNNKGELVFNFGNDRGKSVYTNIGLVQWMFSKNFPEDTMEIANQIITNHYNQY